MLVGLIQSMLLAGMLSSVGGFPPRLTLMLQPHESSG
ncbi:hypothetical protein OnM2_c103o11 [Erysiphe neolycopersici]|uniref:Uncharacterized protein n=1 Tax=Erysiphe neolycopersici TaxID=212602 RepID=A0A420I7X5_9PEZI|nr:hypothetical protein OnM2_c103o11 [Erysiphe neolycopersici]